MSGLLEVRDLRCRYARSGAPAVDGVSFEVADGELLALVGPSGCGKSTTLRAVAGLEPVESGRIALRGRPLASEGVSVPPEARGIGLVFQDLALFPHLSALENVAFGLSRRPRAEATSRAEELLSLVSLKGLEARRPGELSGGQQQRVAVARALAPEPALLLLDEPFSSLDASLREDLRREVRALLKRLGMAAMLVTHDRDEVFAFADRVAVMNAGKLEQVGNPDEVYASPRTAFVASLMGDCTLLPARASGMTAESALGTVPLRERAEGNVQLVVRPEDVEVAPAPASASASASVEGVGGALVRERRYRGAWTQLLLDVGEGAPTLNTRVQGNAQLREGERVRVSVKGALAAVPLA